MAHKPFASHDKARESAAETRDGIRQGIFEGHYMACVHNHVFAGLDVESFYGPVAGKKDLASVPISREGSEKEQSLAAEQAFKPFEFCIGAHVGPATEERASLDEELAVSSDSVDDYVPWRARRQRDPAAIGTGAAKYVDVQRLRNRRSSG